METTLPINLYQVPTISPNPDYVNNLIANGVIQDFFVPGTTAQNPIFSQVKDLNEKIAILQTATKSLNTILNYIDILKKVTPTETEVINKLVDEINDTIKNSTFNSLPIFNQTLKIGDNTINLSIPALNLNDISLEDYEKLITQKQQDIFDVLKNISINLPTNTNFNPYDTQTFETLLNSGLLSTAYKKNLIDPLTLELLLS